MLQAWEIRDERLRPTPMEAKAAVWWDLFTPTREEEQGLEACLGLELPTQEDMQEIEATSRLYSENGGHFMTVLVPSHTDGDDTVTAPVTFILFDGRLTTIRYTEPRAFTVFPARAAKSDLGLTDGVSIMLGLVEAIIDRIADVLERVEREIDEISNRIFGLGQGQPAKQGGWQAVLTSVGRKGALMSRMRASLATLERMLAYLGPRKDHAKAAAGERLAALAVDVHSLTDHAGFIDQKISFLLDATLGMINIDQNNTIKVLSVVSVVFVPPTLVASIYGMNFKIMPELDWTFGYPLALGLMVLSGVLPFWLFKRRGWL